MSLPVNDYSDSRAILIAISEYEDSSFPDVPAAKNSLDRLNSVLAHPALCGWPEERIEIFLNPAGSSRLAQRIRRVAEETTGTLFVYFVGHGVLTETGELCLVLRSTEASDPDLTGLEFSRIRHSLINSPAQTKIVVLDCCYSGRVVHGLSGTSESLLADASEIAGTCTLTAADQTAHVPQTQTEETCTSFTNSLLDVIQDGLPNGLPTLTLGNLYQEVKKRLRALDLPAPNQRGTDTVHLYPVSWNASYGVRDTAKPLANFALTMSEEEVVQLHGVELGNQLATLLEQSPKRRLCESSLEEVRDLPGLYRLLVVNSAGEYITTYIGAADGSLKDRLRRQHRKLAGRCGIDRQNIFFSRLYVSKELASFGSKFVIAAPLIRNLDLEWNRNGFGNLDPGRSRDGARLSSSHFDVQHPIDLSYCLEFSSVGAMSVAEILHNARRQLPYVLRGELGDANLSSVAFDSTERQLTAHELFTVVSGLIDGRWQITAFPGYVTIYRGSVNYPSAWRYYRSGSVIDQKPEFLTKRLD
ncbi:caspase family protein [Micromonospora zamorensis]|uniref:caspase, EACC1-associated type n=1 Tax=Micromonospora zamorensis TaxID=709883 RepID=UPI002E1B3210